MGQVANRVLRLLFCLTCASLAACGKDASEGDASAGAAVGEIRNYDWYLEGTTPAGRTTIVRSGDGRITNESFVHWNNREYTLDSVLQLDEDGYVVSQRLTGTSAFGATIDEEFTFANGVAAWRTPGEGGSVSTSAPAFYLPNEFGAMGSLGALVRKAEDSLDGEVALFPAGTARVERVSDATVETPAGKATIYLYAISGIGFTPRYAWFDGNLDLVAFDLSGWLSMLPKGWNADVLGQLSAAQAQADADYMERIAGDLANRIDAPLVFQRVNVVDVEAGTVLADHYVQVVDGRITDVSDTPIDATDAIVVDGAGRYLIPGLWDMHGHFGLSDGVLNIAGGITSVRDIGNVHERVIEMHRKFDSGEVIGPNTYRAGFMDKAGPFASGWAAESLDDALGRVDFFNEHGYIQIKLYSSIEPAWVRPIAERAHGHGMRLSGHVPAFMSAEQAVRAGYDEIQHINMVFLNFLAGDREDTRKQLRFTLYGDEARNLDLDSEEVQDFFALLKANDVVIDPTAAIFETMLIHRQGEPDPTFAAVIDHLPPSVRRPMYNPDMDMTGRAETWAESNARQSEMLKALYDHGIQLVPGSDHIAAFTVHRELEVYVEAGIPAAAVLKMATLDSARVVGAARDTGSVTAGKVSDLVLLDANPLQDISAVRRALLVMKGDTVYRPDHLYEAVGVEPFLPSVEL
ncbi:MAG: amidohydrolase family protein [Woeseiaceae bacterium]|nr:amidohydrolase family protein [Woeseiaceae bacterium]